MSDSEVQGVGVNLVVDGVMGYTGIMVKKGEKYYLGLRV